MLGQYMNSVGNRIENHNIAKPNFTPLPGYSDNYINVRDAVFNIAGVYFTILAITMLLATLIPKGDFSLILRSLYSKTLKLADSENELIESTWVKVAENSTTIDLKNSL